MSTKQTRLFIRISEKEKRILQARADMYTNGNISEWVRFCLDNANPKQKKAPISEGLKAKQGVNS